MVKQYYNKGFTLLELIMILAIVSVCTILVLPFYKYPDFSIYDFSNQYLYLQSECIRKGESDVFQFDGNAFYKFEIKFNEKGNIRQAQTIHFENGKSVTSNLGGGRLEFKE